MCASFSHTTGSKAGELCGLAFNEDQQDMLEVDLPVKKPGLSAAVL